MQEACQCFAVVSAGRLGRHQCSTTEPGDGQSGQAVGDQVRRAEAGMGEDPTSDREAKGMEDSEVEMDRHQQRG